MTTITTRVAGVRAWLHSPVARVFVPRSIRADIEVLAALCTAKPPVTEHLTSRPAVGTRVRLLADDWFLRDRIGAVRGSLGTIAAHSRLNPDDNGVLVAWGNGDTVRCDLQELASAD